MNFLVVIAARTGSSRLPGKALLPIMSVPVISFLIRRLKRSKLAKNILLATTKLTEDDVLVDTALQEGIEVFRGTTNDVLKRYVEAASLYSVQYIVRVTGDCPFVDGATLDMVLERCMGIEDFDLVTTKPAYPHGIDYEVYRKDLLAEINDRDISAEDREHILNYIYRDENGFKIVRLDPPRELVSHDPIFLLDTPEDYQRMTELIHGIEDIYVAPSVLIRKHDRKC